MSVNDMRQELAKVYNTFSWRYKVEKMVDAQVMAIYLKYKKEGRV